MKRKWWRFWERAKPEAPTPREEAQQRAESKKGASDYERKQKALRRRQRMARIIAQTASKPRGKPIQPYRAPPGVIPEGKLNSARQLAMDATPYNAQQLGLAVGYGEFNYYFPGYPALSGLAQLPEYRKMSETIAKEMTRKWIRLTATGGDDKTERLAQLEDALERYKLQALFRRAAEYDGFYGRGQIYVDLKGPDNTVVMDNPEELALPLILSSAKVAKGSLRGFKAIEPVWTYPGPYNSDNPMAPDFFRPTTWYVMGKTVHHSRLLTFVSREVPDLLKASYNFGGLSLSQMAQPYVEHWIRTRDSVSDSVHSFSVNGVKTDMSSVLQEEDGDDTQFVLRAQMFNNLRDNRGLMMLDFEGEDYFQYNIPLSGLDKLQAQSQEHMSSVSSIPLVKFTGISPTGLNASSEGEIKVWYDDISALQNHIFRDNIEFALKVIQLSEFGEIDPAIGFEFETLHETNQVEAAEVRKSDAETAQLYYEIGALSPQQVAKALSEDEDSPLAAVAALSASDDDLGADPEGEQPDLDGLVEAMGKVLKGSGEADAAA